MKNKYLFIFSLTIFLLFTASCDKDELLVPKGVTGSVEDIEGNVYNVITIGKQEWTAENLRTAKYRDGTDISENEYFWYNDDKEKYKNTYGALYTWFAVETGKLCTEGWRVPSYDEWTVLINNLGGTAIAGGKLKETGIENWKSPNAGATNETKFTALPGGMGRYGSYPNEDTTIYGNIRTLGIWWISSKSNGPRAKNIKLFYHNEITSFFENYMYVGYSVRCVRDIK